MTVNDDPSTTRADDEDTSEKHDSTRGLGTFSPKNTTSGLSSPPHAEAVHHGETAGLLKRHVPVRIDRGLEPRGGPRRVRRAQARVKFLARRPRPARQAHDLVQRPVQFGHGRGTRRLVQPVHVLRDDTGDEPGPLERGDGAVPGVRRRPGDVPPPEVRPRPVALPGPGRPGELLIGHRLRGSPRLPAWPAVVGNAGLRRQPGAAQNGNVANSKSLNQYSERLRLTLHRDRFYQLTRRHGNSLPKITLKAKFQ